MSLLRRFIRVGLLALVALATSVQAQLPFQLPPRPSGPYEIRGVVFDAKTRQPLADAELSLQESAQPANPAFEVIQSRADGSFRFTNLAEGTYTLRGSRQGYAQQALLQHENFWTGVAVGAGKDSVHVRFRLSPSATITGRVTDENGEGVRGAGVTLWTEQVETGRRSVQGAGTTLADDEGRYRFEHLLAGKYSVSVTAVPWYSRYGSAQQFLEESGIWRNRNGRGAATTGTPVLSEASGSSGRAIRTALPDVVYPVVYYPNARDWRGMEWMNLQAGQVDSADFHLSPEPSVHLQIHVEESESSEPPNVALLMDLPGGAQSNATPSVAVMDSGVMEISGVAAGRYRVQADGWRGSEREMEQEIDLAGNSQVQLEQAPAGLPILGEIRLAEGELKIEPMLLRLTDAKGHTYDNLFYGNSEQQGHPAGSFQFERTPAGPQVFELAVLQPQDAVVKQIEAKGAKITGTTIETDGSQEVDLIVTVARSANAIAGVARKDGKPFAGAMILLMPENSKDWERLVRRDQSDSDGSFRLSTILPGKYALIALENGWDLEWSKPGVLQPFLAKAQKLEIGEGQIEPVALEVQ
jgi:Carboxypeptidase regulatory-like domain